MFTTSELVVDQPNEIGIQPPKANINPIFGLMGAARGDLLQFFTELSEIDQIVQLPNPAGRLYLVNDANFIDYILVGNHRNYPKSDYYERIKPIFGNGLFELEGEAWKRKRKAFNPSFRAQNHDYFLQRAVATAGETVDQIGAHRGSQTDISRPFMEGTLSFIIDALCSSRPEIDFQAFSEALAVIMREGEKTLWALVPSLRHVPSKRKREFERAVQTFDRLMYDLIDARLSGSSKGNGDLLDLLIAQKCPETGEPVSLKEVRDDLLTMLVAGHETTALALSWAFYLLSKSPDWRIKLEQEADSVDLEQLRYADLKSLPISAQIGQEALRLYPPLWSMSRKAVEDDKIGPFAIPAGTNLMISPYLIHRNRRYWTNPTAFDPSRFAPERSQSRPKGTFFPFGAGPRVCIGKHMALMELQVFLLAVAQKYRLHLSASCQVEPEPMISLRPKHGIVMDIEARR